MGGAILGGLFLCMLAFVLICVMRTDPEMSQRMDMPMPEFARRLSPWLNVMLFAIYSSVAENYYNFPLRLKEERGKKKKIILITGAGFLLGLMGFKNVVAYMFPLEGFAGIAIILLLTINFIQAMKSKTKKGTVTNV